MNLPKICEALSDQYMEQAMINFASEYLNAYEQILEGRIVFNSREEKLIKNIVKAASNIYTKEFGDNTISDMLFETRGEVMSSMEALTAFTDYFRIHEYLLERVKYQFEDNAEIDNDEEARKILKFIFEPEDNMEVNLRIKEMISELPVRMTSDRFFDLIKDSLTVYKGAEKNSLDSFIYMIKSAAGLHEAGREDLFPDLVLAREEFDAVDYREVSGEDYEYFSGKLTDVSEYIEAKTEFYISIQKLINNIFTYYLVKGYGSNADTVAETVKPCVEAINNSLCDINDYSTLKSVDEEIVSSTFGSLEGRPEKLMTKIAISEGNFESAKEDITAVSSKAYDDITIASKLMSTSDFVSFDAIDITECSAEMIEAAAAAVIDEIKTAFEGKCKQYRRAMMASVLKELPVFFVSHTEVMNYVRNTLECCKNLGEKTASLNSFWNTYR